MLVIMVAAFLAMQWFPAHAHLADHHDHNGSHHQHDIEVHAHQSIDTPDSVDDSTHQLGYDDVKVVELECECNLKNGQKLDNQPIALNQAVFKLSIFSRTGSLESPESNTFRYSYLDYSTIHLRAPPKPS